MNSEEDKYVIWLSLCKNIGCKGLLKLVKYFGSAKKVYDECQNDFKNADKKTIGAKAYESLIKAKNYDIGFYIDKLHHSDIKYVTYYDDDYPELLKEIYDPPSVLYYKGDIAINNYTLAVVGSRYATYYGLKVAENLSYELAERGIIIVSGMARGIDSISQRSALRAGQKTIAVLGCGIDIVYPKENKKLYDDIIEKGAVISEYPPGTKPIPQNFPRRNRIISGLSRGVVVVEAGRKSGSLITADCALEQGRDVYAVPGNILSSLSIGCNNLIKDGAKIVTCIDDIIEEICGIDSVKSDEAASGSSDLKSGLSEIERKIYDLIENQPLNVEVIANILNIEIEKINYTLSIMELKGYVKQLPSKFFVIDK